MNATTPPLPAAADATLRWRTRATSRHLLQGFLGAFAIAAVSGGLLLLGIDHGNLVQVLLVSHLAAGLLALLLFIPFIVTHWRDGREPLVHLVWPFRLIAELGRDAYARQRLIGHALLWALALVLLSGLIVMLPAIAYLAGWPVTLPYGSHVGLLAAHAWLTLPLLVGLLGHLPKEDRA